MLYDKFFKSSLKWCELFWIKLLKFAFCCWWVTHLLATYYLKFFFFLIKLKNERQDSWTYVFALVNATLEHHCIKGAQAMRFGAGHLPNDSFRSCRGEKETVLHLRYPALCRRRNRHLGAYYIDDLSDLSKIDIGSLSRFIVHSRWLQD